MNILIDIGHPAHVHYFRNLHKLLSVNHKVLVSAKSDTMINALLQFYGIPFINLGSRGISKTSKAINQVKSFKAVHDIIIREKIDLAIGASMTIPMASKFTSAHTILFDDDDQSVQPLTAKYVTPFANVVLSPEPLAFEALKNAIYYPGSHELAYLHPNRFKPNPEILTKYSILADEKYFILRFNAFKAHHDAGESGMSTLQKRELVQLLGRYGKVFITSESKLDAEFEPYRLPVAPYEMHHLLAFATVLVSDSQTMTSEAAVLGVPSFRCNSFAGRLAILEEEEKRYGLTHAFLPRQFTWMVERIDSFLTGPDSDIGKTKQHKFLEDKIDVTAFWLWFVENYPNSLAEVRKNGISKVDFK